MLLPMAVIAATTRKALERECAACNTKTVFPPSHMRVSVHCPQCGAAIPPEDLGKAAERWRDSRTENNKERRTWMFRTLEEHAERFYGKRPGLLMRMVRFKGLVITSVLVIGMLLTVVMSLD